MQSHDRLPRESLYYVYEVQANHAAEQDGQWISDLIRLQDNGTGFLMLIQGPRRGISRIAKAVDGQTYLYLTETPQFLVLETSTLRPLRPMTAPLQFICELQQRRLTFTPMEEEPHPVHGRLTRYRVRCRLS